MRGLTNNEHDNQFIDKGTDNENKLSKTTINKVSSLNNTQSF